MTGGGVGRGRAVLRVLLARARHQAWRVRAHLARPRGPAWPPSTVWHVPSVSPAVALYCAYVPAGRLRPFQREAVQQLRAAGLDVVLCLNQEKRVELDDVAGAACVVRRPNAGFDFAAWRDGAAALRSAGAAPRLLVLLNDSVYGPLPRRAGPWEPPGADDGAWAPVQGREPARHLQSWCIVLRGRAAAAVLDEWLPHVHDLRRKEQVIAAYEVGLSRWLAARGFPVQAALDGQRGADGLTNPAHSGWERLLQHGIPFVKRELLFDDPFGAGARRTFEPVLSELGYGGVTTVLDDLQRGRR